MFNILRSCKEIAKHAILGYKSDCRAGVTYLSRLLATYSGNGNVPIFGVLVTLLV